MELENDASVVYHCGLTPKKLPVCVFLIFMMNHESLRKLGFDVWFSFILYQELVENNPLIAVEILTNLIKSPDISAEYAFYLIHLPLTNTWSLLFSLFLFAYLWIQILYSTCQYGHESTLNGSCEQAYNRS
jgi:hypothetical protein